VPPGYRGLVDRFRKRRIALGLDQADVTEAAGMTEGYIAKLESFARLASPPMLDLWAQTLGLKLKPVPAPLPPATRAAIANRSATPYDITKARFK
jgi:transcriptional regulator with XRE-family HTH domain